MSGEAPGRDELYEAAIREFGRALDRLAAGYVADLTRSEILMRIGAALLFVAVTAWRFAPVHDRLQEVGFTAVIAWVGRHLDAGSFRP